MFGFVNSNREKRKIGNEIYQDMLRRRIIGYSVLGVVAFVILNLILYYLTKF